MKRTFLPDVNVWMALRFDHHVHHRPALEWFNALRDEGLVFCRLTQQGLLRLATNAVIMKEQVRTLTGAWELYDTIVADPRVSFAVEPPAIEAQWRQLTQGSRASTHLWNDAYLAAFALTGGQEVVTFDR